MNLYLLRHGLAAESSASGRDSDRPLTPKGERKLRQAAKAMEALKLPFDLILSSPYLRARQTAEVVAETFGAQKRLEFSDTLKPNGSANELVQLLRERVPAREEVLLVGHEPFLSELIGLLVTGGTTSTIVMKKGGLCKLAIESLKPGRCAALEWLLTPKQMKLMA